MDGYRPSFFDSFWQQVRSAFSSCYLCGNKSAGPIFEICSACLEDLPWLWEFAPSLCSLCAQVLGVLDSHPICGQCQQYPPPFVGYVIPFAYRPPVDSLIKRFKHQQHLYCGELLVDLFCQLHRDKQQAGKLGQGDTVDCLVPLPSHWRRVLWRGLDHSTWLTHRIGRRLGLEVIPLLSRVRATPQQQGLKRNQRMKNLEDAFVANLSYKRHLPRIRSVALVDDVMTTGSSARQAAATLKSLGIETVHLWCLARTPL